MNSFIRIENNNKEKGASGLAINNNEYTSKMLDYTVDPYNSASLSSSINNTSNFTASSKSYFENQLNLLNSSFHLDQILCKLILIAEI